MKSALTSLLAILVVAGFVQAAPAGAEPLPHPKIVVIDLITLSEKSAATRDLTARVEAAELAFKKDLAFKYEALQDELRAFRVEAASLPARERSDRDNAIRQKIADLGAEEQAGLARIEARAEAAMAALQDDFKAVIKDVAEGLEADLVIEKAAYDELLTAGKATAPAEDVTGIVLAFLDQRIPGSGFDAEETAP